MKSYGLYWSAKRKKDSMHALISVYLLRSYNNNEQTSTFSLDILRDCLIEVGNKLVKFWKTKLWIDRLPRRLPSITAE